MTTFRMRPIMGPGGRDVLNDAAGRATVTSAISPATTTGVIAIGSILAADSSHGGYRALNATDEAADSVCRAIRHIASGQFVKKGYLTSAEVLGAAYHLEASPIGGVIFEIEEDGVGGGIADTDVGNYYALNINSGALDYTDGVIVDEHQRPVPQYQLDSSSKSSTVSTTAFWRLVGLAKGDYRTAGTDAAGAVIRRRFYITPSSTVVTAAQA